MELEMREGYGALPGKGEGREQEQLGKLSADDGDVMPMGGGWEGTKIGQENHQLQCVSERLRARSLPFREVPCWKENARPY